MEPFFKTLEYVEESEDLGIQFTPEELDQLGLKIGDKFSWKINKDKSISLFKLNEECLD